MESFTTCYDFNNKNNRVYVKLRIDSVDVSITFNFSYFPRRIRPKKGRQINSVNCRSFKLYKVLGDSHLN